MRNKLLQLSLIIVLTNFAVKLNAQIYSFEDAKVPSGWKVSNGVLNPSTTKYKLGSKSLSWSWNAGSVLTVSNPDGLSAVSKNNNGGINLWIYNTVASPSKLVFAFFNSEKKEKCHIDFNLNFKGWRCLHATFNADMGSNKAELTEMTVSTPVNGNGLIYLDYLEFSKSIKWDRMSDAQYDVVQNPITPDFKEIRTFGDIEVVKKATAEEKAAADVITNRLENWYLASEKQLTAPEFKSRKEAIDRQIKYALTRNVEDLNLKTASDGTIIGAGLFPDYMSVTIGGTKIRKFKDIMTGCMLPLAYDYRMNKNELSKTRMLNILDWFNDQGWADGSAMGGLNFEKLRSAGYFHSLFLIRNELDTAHLSRELNTLNWFGKVGLTNKHFETKGENADDIRALVMAKLAYALMQRNVDKRAMALTSLTNYLNNAYAIAPGLSETFKPDYSGYHHANPYLSAYYPEALYVAALTYYLLHDTPYALSESVYTTLKNCLLTFRLSASLYYVPVSLSGRFPTTGPTLSQNVAAYAYLALSKKQPDTELLAAFGRLWNPTVSPMKEEIARAATEICLRTTLGETELCLKAASLAVPAEKNPVKSLFLPYSGLLIHRNENNYVAIKGYSKYIFDYEASANENLWGRYLSNGQIEFTHLPSNRRNNAYRRSDWDWSRIPGTTAKYLPRDKMAFSNAFSHRNFSDKSFLGGIAFNDTVSWFSVQLHDIAYDKTFFANKSVFCFGNVLLCVGSGISDSARTVRTETTLFQHDLRQGEQLLLNGKKIKKQTENLQNATIQDNLGNCFIVNDGKTDIIQTDSMVAAVINHGTAPANEKYSYFMLLQPDKKLIARYANEKTCPQVVLRYDKTAHIVADKASGLRAYAIFEKDSALNDNWIEKVNIASLVMLQPTSNGLLQLALSDPDMHRPSATSLHTLKEEIAVLPSKAFNYEITLKGRFNLDGENPTVKVSNADSSTKLTLKVIDGKTYHIKLRKL